MGNEIPQEHDLNKTANRWNIDVKEARTEATILSWHWRWQHSSEHCSIVSNAWNISGLETPGGENHVSDCSSHYHWTTVPVTFLLEPRDLETEICARVLLVPGTVGIMSQRQVQRAGLKLKVVIHNAKNTGTHLLLCGMGPWGNYDSERDLEV